MPLSVKQYEPVSAIMEHGRITIRQGDRFSVDTESGTFSAARALGCLVEPLSGDLVLVSVDARGNAYILSVLERPENRAATLDFQGDVVIRSQEGRIGLVARKGVDLVGEEEIRMAAAEMNVSAARGEMHVDRLSYWGSRLTGRITALKVISDKVESFCERMTTVVRNAFRQVEETDQLNCGNLHYQAENMVHLKGEYAKIAAREDVAINGERINIG